MLTELPFSVVILILAALSTVGLTYLYSVIISALEVCRQRFNGLKLTLVTLEILPRHTAGTSLCSKCGRVRSTN